MGINFSKSSISEKVLDKKVLFIGFDGASKKIIDKMIRRKELPAIERLINTGSSFHSSHSFRPCASPVIWTSMATGKRPEKHGISGFHDNTYSLTAKRIWEIFNMYGFPVGVMGHMLTWPPKELNGFIIPSILSLGKQCYPEEYGFLWELTHDAENEKKISPKRMLNYFSRCRSNGISLSTFFEIGLGFAKKRVPILENLDKYAFISSISMRTKLYRDLFIHLQRKFRPKYAYFHIHFVDTYSHYYWQYMEPGTYKKVSADDVRRYGRKVYNAYRNADRIIQEIISHANSDTLIVIASDHGFRSLGKTQSWADTTTIRAQKFIDLDKKGDLYISVIIPTIHALIRNLTPEKAGYYKTFLHSIEVVEDKKPLFEVEETAPGNFLLEFNREIAGISGKHILVDGKSYDAGELLMDVEDYTPGIHDAEDGILILNGPGARKNIHGKDPVSIFDITPTILAMCNMPVARDMDGSVITEAIEEDFLNKYPVQYIDTYEDSLDQDRHKKELSDEEARNLKEQLKSLGYF